MTRTLLYLSYISLDIRADRPDPSRELNEGYQGNRAAEQAVVVPTVVPQGRNLSTRRWASQDNGSGQAF